jgi:hypothetical protein
MPLFWLAFLPTEPKGKPQDRHHADETDIFSPAVIMPSKPITHCHCAVQGKFRYIRWLAGLGLRLLGRCMRPSGPDSVHVPRGRPPDPRSQRGFVVHWRRFRFGRDDSPPGILPSYGKQAIGTSCWLGRELHLERIQKSYTERCIILGITD